MGSVGPTNPTRQLKVVLDRDTSRSLGNSGYQLQVAKSVVNQNGNRASPTGEIILTVLC